MEPLQSLKGVMSLFTNNVTMASSWARYIGNIMTRHLRLEVIELIFTLQICNTEKKKAFSTLTLSPTEY